MKRERQSETDKNGETLVAVACRYGAYTVCNFAAVLAIWGLARVHGAMMFSEGSVLEWAQFGIMLIGAAMCITMSFRIMEFSVLLRILGMLCLLAAIRESDRGLDKLIPFLGWQLPFHAVLLGGVLMVWKNFEEFLRQVRYLAGHRAFGMMWAGFMVAIPFGQMIGHGAFLRDLFGDDYERPMKRVIEESAETIGYLIIVLANLEFILSLRSRLKRAM